MKTHSELLELFEKNYATSYEERLLAIGDRRFYSVTGAQWEGQFGQQFANRPRIEINKIHMAVMRIINEWRNNRISVKFTRSDGSKTDKTAEICEGLYRADEDRSVAVEAYDTAFEEAVGGGFGAFRLVPEYEDEFSPDEEYQRIGIEPITDADQSVFFDSSAKRQDKRDAEFCFVIQWISPESYRKKYDDDPNSWPTSYKMGSFDWATKDLIAIAEYYEIDETSNKRFYYRRIDGTEFHIDQSEIDRQPDILLKPEITTSTKIREKRFKSRACKKTILSGGKVLVEPETIPGGMIPVIPVFGKRWFVDGIERSMGHVRLAKDAQRLKNIQVSSLAETAVSFGIEKPIFLPEQIAGHELLWSQDNVQNNPYLLINPIIGPDGTEQPAGPVGKTTAPQLPPALVTLLELTEADMKEVLGNQQNGEVVKANVSGEAVSLVQQKIDMVAFIYLSNFAKAVRRAGEIWLSMARELYVEPGRNMKIVGSQKEIDSVTLGKSIIGEDGRVIATGDLSNAKYDVRVDVGPSFSSKRKATVSAVMGLLPMIPDQETQSVLISLAMMNLDGEGLDDTKEFFRKRLVKLGVLEPTTEDKRLAMAEQQKAQGQQQPDPQAQFLAAQTQKTVVDTKKSAAQTQKIQAETQKIVIPSN